MRITCGWLGLLLLVSTSAQAADLDVTRVEPSVFVRHANGNHATLSSRDSLRAGDTVSTGAQGHASIRLAGGGSLLLGPNLALQIDSTQPPEPPARATLAKLTLNSGALRVDARKTDQGMPADVHLKLRYLQARFYGTDAWVEHSAAGDEICLIAGAAEIDTPGAHQRLDTPGECLRWTRSGGQHISASAAGSLLPRLAATNFSDDYATRYAANQAMQDGADRPTLAQSLPQATAAAPLPSAGNTLTVTEGAPIVAAAKAPHRNTPSPQSAPARAASRTAKPEWRIALGVFSSRANADRSVAQWRARKLHAEIEVISLKGRTAYRLLCGHYANREQADAALTRLRARPGYREARVLEIPDRLSRRR